MRIQRFGILGLVMGMTASVPLALTPAPVAACGGFFCSAANPVNQAAEQIIFSDNGDGTVTAVIQIMYEGPAREFAWLLPIPGVPDVEVSSNLALDRLNQATNPLYQLNTVFEGECGFFGFPTASQGPAPFDAVAEGDDGGSVMVLAEKQVGPYDTVTISVNPEADDAAQEAVDWLTTNGYDVTDIGPDVLRPYLEEGLNLIAMRLSKGNDVGSLRPIMITYAADLPSIPLRPTAVAATNDMGIKVWVLGGERAIPKNYKGLVLNEALIDWFNPGNTYDEVVSLAADEAGGQGFVTEFAGTTDSFEGTIMQPWERDQWDTFSSTTFASDIDMVRQATQSFGGWDGFDEALAAATTLPADVDFEDFQLCFLCYSGDPGFAFDQGTFLQGLFENVIKPVIDTEELIGSRPYMTRLYTTMSADEMTIDPVFDFNPDLGDYDNFHQADRVVRCDDPNADPNLQPWSVELAQGDSVMGTEFGVWPVDIMSQPAALQILQFGTSGQGEMVTDNADMVSQMMDDQNSDTMRGGDDDPADGSTGGSDLPGAGMDIGGSGDAQDSASDGTSTGNGSSGGGGCAVAASDAGDAATLWLGALGLLLWRRRRRA